MLDPHRYMTLLLVHSPLTGPSVWRPLARAAETRGHRPVVPDATSFVVGSGPFGPRFVQLAGPPIETAETLIIVGHSGAGAFLPGIAERMRTKIAGLVFVDAILPPEKGAHRTPDAMLRMIDQRSRDGLLDRWIDWWPEDVIAQLLPDPTDRAALGADMPHVPRALYDEHVPAPAGWGRTPCGYLRLSPAYDAELEEAERRRWPTASLAGDHLAIYTAPTRVLDELERMIDLLGRPVAL